MSLKYYNFLRSYFSMFAQVLACVRMFAQVSACLACFLFAVDRPLLTSCVEKGMATLQFCGDTR